MKEDADVLVDSVRSKLVEKGFVPCRLNEYLRRNDVVYQRIYSFSRYDVLVLFDLRFITDYAEVEVTAWMLNDSTIGCQAHNFTALFEGELDGVLGLLNSEKLKVVY